MFPLFACLRRESVKAEIFNKSDGICERFVVCLIGKQKLIMKILKSMRFKMKRPPVLKTLRERFCGHFLGQIKANALETRVWTGDLAIAREPRGDCDKTGKRVI